MLKTVFFEVAGSVKQNNNLLGGFRQRNPPVSQSILGFPPTGSDGGFRQP